MVRGSIHQENRTILNRDAPNDRIPNSTRQKLTELKEIDKSTIIFGDIVSSFSIINRIISRMKISMDLEDNTINLT